MAGEKYLNPEQHYIDLYDLMTIKKCLRTIESAKKSFKKEIDAGKFKNLSDEDKRNDFARVVRLILFFDKAHEYKYKQETIDKWIQKDKERQEKYDNAAPDTVYCSRCNSLMADTFKTLHDLESPYRVLFFYDCPKCNNREAAFDNGEKYEKKVFRCKKCNGELRTEIKDENGITTWTEKCTKCEHEKVEVENNKEKEEKRKEDEKRDKLLLEKYRSEFCLSEEDGQEHVNSIDHLKRIGKWMMENEKKENDPAYEKARSIKQYKVIEVNKIIKEAIKNKGFTNLVFEKPDLGRIVQVPFTVEDTDSNRDKYDSKKVLKKLIVKALEDTNWRLMSDGVNYRVGYLSGRLRCYENSEELAQIL